MLDKEYLKKLEHDKYMHFKYGFILFLFFNLFTSKARKIVSFIAWAKEFTDGLGFGTKEQKDYDATVRGADAAKEFLEEYFNRG